MVIAGVVTILLAIKPPHMGEVSGTSIESRHLASVNIKQPRVSNLPFEPHQNLLKLFKDHHRSSQFTPSLQDPLPYASKERIYQDHDPIF